MNGPEKEDVFDFEGLVTEFEGKPVVVMTMGGEKMGYMAPHHAVQLGLRAIQAGMQADHMSAIHQFLMEGGTNAGSIARFLSNMMEYKVREKVWDYRTLLAGEKPDDLIEPQKDET